MEIAYWPDSCSANIPGEAQRVYWGHETCMNKMLARQDLVMAAKRLRDSGQQMTLVTPFLTEVELDQIVELIKAISASIGRFEVVCNDWGLLCSLAEYNFAEPAIGRLLTGQATDPRLAAFDLPERQRPHERSVLHANGTIATLRYRRPTDTLMSHLRRCSIDIPETLTYMHQLGVRRLEVSNPLQGIEMTLQPDLAVTLHLPEVPVAIARHQWNDGGTQWLHPTFPVPLYQRDNIIFYRNETLPANMDALPIDRIVYRI